MSTAIVTGAAGAIGTALADTLRGRGWQVIGLDLEAGEEIIACDITSDESVGAAVPQALAELGGGGGLHALVNNAGLGGPASAGASPDQHVRRMIDVNLLGAWRVTAAAIEPLVQARGQAVFVGSRMAFLGLPLGAAYGVSKRGLTAYADALRAEYGTHVGVTCVHPAYVRTPIHDRTKAAGLQLEGFSHEEPLEGVVAKIVAACEGRPGRDVAITRGGALQLAAARHLPGIVDRVVARTLRNRIAKGELDAAPIAAGLRRRHGRTR